MSASKSPGVRTGLFVLRDYSIGVAAMKPKKENLRKSLELVTDAEKEWRAAWNGQVPAIGSSAMEISNALATARDFLRALVNE
jgi:hypothetical protein